MTNEVPYGTQLSFWEDHPSERDIVFSVTYCQHGCPFNGVHEARDKESTVFVQRFGRELEEPAKYVLVVKQDFFTHLGDKLACYIMDDQWEAYAKITELTGRRPLWRMSITDEHRASGVGTYEI